MISVEGDHGGGGDDDSRCSHSLLHPVFVAACSFAVSDMLYTHATVVAIVVVCIVLLSS
jgi:hypothetical protein